MSHQMEIVAKGVEQSSALKPAPVTSALHPVPTPRVPNPALPAPDSTELTAGGCEYHTARHRGAGCR
jgi:hypothetical protein